MLTYNFFPRHTIEVWQTLTTKTALQHIHPADDQHYLMHT